jgi:uncharacterized HhH-GPD family protein
LRAWARSSERAGSTGTRERLAAIPSLEQRHDQCGAEGVTSGGAVNRPHARRAGSRNLLAAVEQHCPVGPKGERDQPSARPSELVLVAVDDQKIRLDRQPGSRRRGVQAEERCTSSCPRHGVRRYLQLTHDSVSFTDLDVAWQQPPVRTRRNDDHVVAVRIHENQRDAGFPVVANDAARVDSLALQRTQHEIVAPDPPYEPHARTESGRRDRLVGALSPGDAFKHGIRDRLAETRQALAARHVIDVCRTDHRDPHSSPHPCASYACPTGALYHRPVPSRLYFTDSDEANALIASDPLALLVGFALDQQVTVQKAFSGPLVLRERLGAFDTQTLASADLEPVFRLPPAIHRFPGSMARRVHDLAVHVRDSYAGDAARIWNDAADAQALRTRLAALPGFGEMKLESLAAVLAKRFGVASARNLVPQHPTLGDVDSPQALADYQAAKRLHKAQWRASAQRNT